MTLRGRLTTAFLAVVLGPVLLGSFFVGMTVATVSRDRTVDRLDHAVTTVRTAIGAVCRQLQAVADAVAVLPETDRETAANQMVTRGLASTVRIGGGTEPGWRDCAAPAGTGVAAIVARAHVGKVTVAAAQTLDAGFVGRLAASSGAEVILLTTDGRTAGTAPSTVAVTVGRGGGLSPPEDESAGNVRRVPSGPGQPLPLAVSVPAGDLAGLYVILAAVVLLVAAGAILVARWLAGSTTRPLADLAWAADRVAEGDLDTRVPVVRHDELGRLAGTFNRMTRELRSYVQALTASRDQLRGHLAILGDTLSSTHDLDRILHVILQTARSATGARAGVVLLIDPAGPGETGELRGFADVREAAGPQRPGDTRDDVLVARCAEGLDALPAPIPLGHGILGTVAATGEARRGRNPGAELACQSYVAVPICAPAMIGDPLVPGGATAPAAPAVIGVLALYDRLGSDEFDDIDLLTLRTFAGQAGIAVQNVRVHEEAQRLSLTDPLTGLWNYRYLRESLRREVERASRFGRMLTVLVLDIDHFKEVNDTYGHAAGDAVLGEFARRIRVGLREVDVAFRQGGEEFVVLLPETDAYGGTIVAERLGAAIRGRPVEISSPRQDVDDIPISVSIGIAVFPEHGITAQQVLGAADDALYAAKNAGRDTYRLAETVSTVVPDGTGGDTAGTGDQGSDRAVVPDAQFDPAATAPGGPQPPRQSRGR